MTTKRKAGRPTVPPEDKAKMRSFRLTDRHFEKLKTLGGMQWLRNMLNQHHEDAQKP